MNMVCVREIRQTYLMAEAEEKDCCGYAARMLEANRIPGLLKYRQEYKNKKLYACYDITSKQSFKTLAESRGVGESTLVMLIGGLKQILEETEPFLLGEDGLCLHPDAMFLNPEDGRLFLCYIPGGKENFRNQLAELMQYCLKYIDHTDSDAVVMAYTLFQESQREGYTISDLLKILEKKKKNQEEILSIYEKESFINMEDSKEADEPEFSAKPKPATGRMLCIFLLCAAASFAFLWLFAGERGTRMYAPFLAAGEALAGIVLLLWGSGRMAKSIKGQKDTDCALQMQDIKKQDRLQTPQKQADEDRLFRSSAAEKTSEEYRRLQPVNPSGEDISLKYYPFLLGSHRKLSDHVLEGEGVSPLHIKISGSESGYEITALDSESSTWINGRALLPQETSALRIGDEVRIADREYVFL